MDTQTTLTFCLAFFVFAASPGPDNLTIFSKTVSDGPAHSVVYGAGVVCSIFCFVIFAAIGLNTLLQYMNENLRIIQYTGSIYLIYSGFTMWRAKPVIKAREIRSGLARLFFMGFFLNISNPKMPIFYLALLPGVLGARPLTVYDTAELLFIILLIEIAVVGGHVFIGYKAQNALTDPNKVRFLNRGAGAMLVGAGILVASR